MNSCPVRIQGCSDRWRCSNRAGVTWRHSFPLRRQVFTARRGAAFRLFPPFPVKWHENPARFDAKWMPQRGWQRSWTRWTQPQEGSDGERCFSERGKAYFLTESCASIASSAAANIQVRHVRASQHPLLLFVGALPKSKSSRNLILVLCGSLTLVVGWRVDLSHQQPSTTDTGHGVCLVEEGFCQDSLPFWHKLCLQASFAGCRRLCAQLFIMKRWYPSLWLCEDMSRLQGFGCSETCWNTLCMFFHHWYPTNIKSDDSEIVHWSTFLYVVIPRVYIGNICVLIYWILVVPLPLIS